MYRGEKALPVKATVDEALKNCASVESVIVIRRDGTRRYYGRGDVIIGTTRRL